MQKLSRRHLAELVLSPEFAGKNSKDLAKEIAKFLLKERRTTDIQSLIRDIQQIRIEHGFVEAVAESAFPLSDAVRKDIEEALRMRYKNAQEIVIDEVVNPKILGGVRVSLPNEQLDLSIASKLQKLKTLMA